LSTYIISHVIAPPIFFGRRAKEGRRRAGVAGALLMATLLPTLITVRGCSGCGVFPNNPLGLFENQMCENN